MAAARGGGASQKQNGDPTTNVLDLVKAAIQRQDDLRAAEFRVRDECVAQASANILDWLNRSAEES